MSNRNFVASMMISGEKNPAFSGTTLKLPPPQTDYLPQIIENTRANFAKPRAEIEQMIASQIQPPMELQSKTAQQNFKRAEKLGNVSGGKIISPSGQTGASNPFAGLNFDSFANAKQEAKHDESVANFAKSNDAPEPKTSANLQSAQATQSDFSRKSELTNTNSRKDNTDNQAFANLSALAAAAATNAESRQDFASTNPKLFPNLASQQDEATEAEIVLRPASPVPDFAKNSAEKVARKSGLDKPLFARAKDGKSSDRPPKKPRNRSRNRNENRNK
jgi:hypothetical protein